MWLSLLCCLLWISAGQASGDFEVVEELGCQNSEFRLKCRDLGWHIALLEAHFTNDVSLLGEDNATCASSQASTSESPEANVTQATPVQEYDIRSPVNHRCSGVNYCSFILVDDHKPAATWGPGVVSLRYACMKDTDVVKFCNEEVLAGEGFIHNPGYPKYYVTDMECYWLIRAPIGQRIQLTILDASLRAVDPSKETCVDRLEVKEQGNTLLSMCGDEEQALVIESESNMLNVTIIPRSRRVFTKRGVLMHYKALGCPALEQPRDGYLVYRNDTYAQFMCCVGFFFPDTLGRERVLQCIHGNTWNDTLPDCTNTTMVVDNYFTLKSMSLDQNMTSEMAVMAKESDFVYDVLLPTLIISVLLIGNAVILYVILYLRKRKISRDCEEELGAIFQPQDATLSDGPTHV